MENVDLSHVRAELEAALLVQGKALGYKFELGTIEYESDGNFSMELTAVKAGNPDEEEKRYLEMAKLLPLPALHSDVQVGDRGLTYEVVGLDEGGKDVILKWGGLRWFFGVRALSALFEIKGGLG
jgi:hypothetical protein